MKSTCHCHTHYNICEKNRQSNYSGASQSNYEREMEEMKKVYADVMEKQLSKLSQMKEQEIDELNKIISSLKTSVSKLQVRGRLDKESEKQMKEQIAHQADRIRNLQNDIFTLENSQKNRKDTVKEIIKEVIVKVPSENSLNKGEIDSLYAENASLKASLKEKEVIYFEKGEQILRELKFRDEKVKQLSKCIEDLEDSLSRKNNEIQHLKNENKFLQEKIQIISKPNTHRLDPVVLKQIEHRAPEISTIYVDRPIKQTQFVEVEKVVRHFVQPERPIVTRVIQCQSPRSKKDDSDENVLNYERHESQLEQISNKYQKVIEGYKNERQNLVKQISERDQDYRLLNKQIQLCSRINGGANNKKSETHVEVTVVKDSEGHKPDHIKANTGVVGTKSTKVGSKAQNKGMRK